MLIAANKWKLDNTFGQNLLNVLVKDDAIADKLAKLVGSDIDIEIKKHRQVRSLTANAYFHVLCNELARVHKTSDDEMKQALVVKYGALKRDSNGKLCGAMIPKGQDVGEYYPYYRWIGETDTCDKYLFYSRTHEMDSKDFATLLDGTISDCKENGIETLPPREIKALIERWDYDKKNGKV